MIPVILGTALALIALGFVLYPLVREDFVATPSRPTPIAPHGLASTAIEALREIEFDHATGKLSDHDYNQLKDSYTNRAIATMRADTRQVSNTIICAACGPRPEANASFCSQCGAALTAG